MVLYFYFLYVQIIIVFVEKANLEALKNKPVIYLKCIWIKEE